MLLADTTPLTLPVRGCETARQGSASSGACWALHVGLGTGRCEAIEFAQLRLYR